MPRIRSRDIFVIDSDNRPIATSLVPLELLCKLFMPLIGTKLRI